MTTKKLRSVAVGLVSIIVVTIGPGALTPTAQASDPANLATEDASANGLQRSSSYWTPQRMAAAQPAKNARPARMGPSSETGVNQNQSAPTFVPPKTGRYRPTDVFRLSAKPGLARGVPRPYTNLPDRLNGKVFFTIGGSPFACSGTVVNSRNRDMVDTAGHCVSDGAGNFHQNWVFVPGYSSEQTGCKSDGCYPFGIWPARRLTVSTEWHQSSNYRQDLGYALLGTSNGQHIVDVVGGQGSAFNLSRQLKWVDFGYPEERPFDGFDQQFCLSRWLSDDVPTDGPGPLAVGIACDMTAGSSGGGWVVADRRRSGLGFVNGHNSYRYLGDEEAASRIYSPYYGSEALSLFRFSESK